MTSADSTPAAAATSVEEGGKQGGGKTESSNTKEVHFQNDETNESPAADGAEEEEDATPENNTNPPPIRRSTRLKGYITLFVSALYNYMAAADKLNGSPSNERLATLCITYDHLSNLVPIRSPNDSRLKYTMSCSMITIILTGIILLIHLDFITPLRKSLWPKWFGQQSSKVELWILLFLTLFWFITTWFNTSIRGPGGEGKDQFNLYFSSWICCWVSFWTLTRWSTASGRASFVTFVRSWPNRCPLWIVMFLLSCADFLFVLDVYRHWEDATVFNPYVYRLYRDVPHSQWILLLFVTCATFMLSFAWVLAEIFRENRTNVGGVKGAVEVYIEGIAIQITTIIWVVTVCIVTMPGGAASLIGNLYFTTWSTLFAVIGTLIWWVRDWRKSILDVIQEQQDEYDKAKRSIRLREEKRLARLAREAREKSSDNVAQQGSRNGVTDGTSISEESKTEEDGIVEEGVLCKDDPAVDDDDITMFSITSDYKRSRLGTGASSIASISPDRSHRERPCPHDDDNNKSHDGGADLSEVSTSRSLFVSALSFLFSPGDDEEQDNRADDNQ